VLRTLGEGHGLEYFVEGLVVIVCFPLVQKGFNLVFEVVLAWQIQMCHVTAGFQNPVTLGKNVVHRSA